MTFAMLGWILLAFVLGVLGAHVALYLTTVLALLIVSFWEQVYNEDGYTRWGGVWKAAWVMQLCFVGLWSSWLVRPILWVYYWSPLRLYRYMLMTAAQESGIYPDSSGVQGERGLLQFADSTWEGLTGKNPDADERWRSPFWQGWYASAYIADGLKDTGIFKWYGLRVPVGAVIPHRVMWRCGVSETCATKQWDNATYVKGEVHTWPGYVAGLLATGSVYALVALYIRQLMKPRKKGKGKKR